MVTTCLGTSQLSHFLSDLSDEKYPDIGGPVGSPDSGTRTGGRGHDGRFSGLALLGKADLNVAEVGEQRSHFRKADSYTIKVRTTAEYPFVKERVGSVPCSQAVLDRAGALAPQNGFQHWSGRSRWEGF